jgi:hypothetical protein
MDWRCIPEQQHSHPEVGRTAIVDEVPCYPLEIPCSRNNFPGNFHSLLIEKWLQHRAFLLRNRLTASSRSSRRSFVRSGHGPFLRPDQSSRRHRAQRPSMATVRPALGRFTLDGREHDGTLAISRDDGVHRGEFRIVHVVERCSVHRTIVVGHTLSGRFVCRSLRGFCH